MCSKPGHKKVAFFNGMKKKRKHIGEQSLLKNPLVQVMNYATECSLYLRYWAHLRWLTKQLMLDCGIPHSIEHLFCAPVNCLIPSLINSARKRFRKLFSSSLDIVLSIIFGEVNSVNCLPGRLPEL